MIEPLKPIRITTLKECKKAGRKIAMLTAYDATMAGLLDRAGVDVLLVGDSLGSVIMGEATTIPVTMEAMVHHTRAVVRGTRRALVVADLPFFTYQISVTHAMRNAGRLVQLGGAAAVKLEGRHTAAIASIVAAGIPVMAHLGLTPQSVHQMGGHVMQGRTEADAARLLEEALAVEAAGAFAIVLEGIPAELAHRITTNVAIPTIGIGAGPHCDGQVLVSYDAFGLFDGAPSFVKQYARLGDLMTEAARLYVADVREGRFPEQAI